MITFVSAQARHVPDSRPIGSTSDEDTSPATTSARSPSALKWTRKKFASWAPRASCCAPSSPPRAQKRRVLAFPILYRSGAPRSMKMGTTASPWRYDAAARHALQSAKLRLPATLHYASWAAAFMVSEGGPGTLHSGRTAVLTYPVDRRDGPKLDCRLTGQWGRTHVRPDQRCGPKPILTLPRFYTGGARRRAKKDRISSRAAMVGWPASSIRWAVTTLWGHRTY